MAKQSCKKTIAGMATAFIALMAILFSPSAGWAQTAGNSTSSTQSPPASPNIDEMQRFDKVLEEVLSSHKVPGGALAIARNGKLIYAQGYGKAILKKNVPFTPTTLSSLASVSKALGAVALLRLVESGKLGLDDKVYDVLGRPTLPGPVADQRVFQITVRQLLHQSAGWKSDDLGYSQQLDKKLAHGGQVPLEEVVKYVFTLPLNYAPDTDSSYSNFTFAVVRLVIEHAAQKGYESYIKEQVLAPMGITDMCLEGPPGHYLPNEAHRYNTELKNLPGGRSHTLISGPIGSWLGSAVDLARFLTAIDNTRIPNFIRKDVLDAMVAAPPSTIPLHPNDKHSGLGWDFAHKTKRGYFFAKDGGINGARAYVEHLPNNVCFAFLMNGNGTSEAGQGKAMGQLIRKIHETAAQTKHWPEVDLFSKYPAGQ